MNPLAIKLISYAITAAICFGAGWRTKAAFIAERDLAIVETVATLERSFKESEGAIATTLENKLSTLKENERTVIREVPKVIIRDVYRNVCLDVDGLQLIERARRGETDTKQPPN